MSKQQRSPLSSVAATWSSVKIDTDFASSPQVRMPAAEIMLRYVAVTRAQHRLDLGPLDAVGSAT